MRNSLIAIAIIVIILVSGVAGYTAGIGQTVTKTQYSTDTSSFTQTAVSILTTTASPITQTSTDTLTSTVTSYSIVTFFTNSISTSQSISCTVLGPSAGVELQVVAMNSAGPGTGTGPVAGLVVNGEDVWYCNNQRQVTMLGPVITNSSGWVSLLDGGNGIYYLNVTYSQYLVYSLSIVTQPTSVTCAVFDASTGDLTSHFYEYTFHCA